MTLRIYLTLQTFFLLTCWRLHAMCLHLKHDYPKQGESSHGQATAEYALVIVGAAAVALLLLGWATGTGKITALLDRVIGMVSDMVK
ncbi:MAG: DUF4244 domain-containing protein [Acidimicrobiaceae bacterium]|nr:DUF4244 domain-containing protein [Acidimicrobiaceae bacterium]